MMSTFLPTRWTFSLTHIFMKPGMDFIQFNTTTPPSNILHQFYLGHSYLTFWNLKKRLLCNLTTQGTGYPVMWYHMLDEQIPPFQNTFWLPTTINNTEQQLYKHLVQPKLMTLQMVLKTEHIKIFENMTLLK